MTEWNDGYYFEAMDRCHTVMVMIDELLNEHPAIEKLDLQEHLDNAIKEIYTAYQKIGEQDET